LLTAALMGARARAASAPALYTNQQATAGAKEYAAQCALCHGARLEGSNGPPLAGANLRTLGEKTHLTIGDMFGYMTTNMPMNAPASLKHDQYVDIMAFILKENGYPSGSKPLTYGAAMNSKQKMTSLKGG
jgi:mono/diheme cytochrome c family protein